MGDKGAGIDQAFLIGTSPAAAGDIALIADDIEVSYGELRQMASEAGSALGLDNKSLVFLLARNEPAAIAGYLGAVSAGHAVAFIDPALSEELLHGLIEAYAPEIIIAPSDMSLPVAHSGDVGSPNSSYIYAFATDELASSGKSAEIHPDLAVLLSTSGTTGSPKFVRLSRQAVEANAHSIAIGLEITANERPITSLPPFYSYGLSVINSHLVRGATIVLTDDSVISPDFWRTFDDSQCTSFAGVPYTYQMLRRIGFLEFELPSLTTLTQAGGKLESSITEMFADHMKQRGGKYFTMYGQTEATARISILPHSQALAKLGSAGVAIEGGKVHFELEGRTTDGPADIGELIYEGPNVMMGYALERADLGRGDDQAGRLETGDLGYLDEDGFIHITGRSKRIAKVFGLRINLDEVEALLKPYGPGAVIGAEDKLIAYCEFDDALFDEVRTAIARKLKVNRNAFQLVGIDSLPLTGNGKIDYKNLPEV